MHTFGKSLSIVIGLLTLGLSATASAAAAQAPPCAFCQDMEGGGGWGHSFQSPGALFDRTYEHAGWGPGICGDYHGGCEPEEENDVDLLAIEQIVNGGDFEVITILLKELPAWVQFVPQRGAIQLRGCGGRIVAHIVLDESVISSLLR